MKPAMEAAACNKSAVQQVISTEGSVFDFEQWIMDKVILKERWFCPADKCTVWRRGELGHSSQVYRRFCDMFAEWRAAKMRMKKAAIIGLMEVAKKLTQGCSS